MGNISETEETSVSNPPTRETRYENALDPCARPPSDGETTVLDSPLDCVGVIVSFLSETRDILNFMSTCKDFYQFFRNQNQISKVTFTLNFNILLKRPLDFVHRLRCLTFYSHKLRRAHFPFFPNLRYLSIERCERPNSISSSIFVDLQYLEEFYVGGGHFYIDNDFLHLSSRIRIFSVKNSSSVYPRVVDIRKERKQNPTLFSDVLLSRTELTEIVLWRVDLYEEDRSFSEKLHQLEKLKKFELRHCSVGSKHPFSFPNGLEELDLSFTTHSCKLHDDFKIPQSVKRLHLSYLKFGIRSFFTGLSKNSDHEEGIYPNIVYLDVSGNQDGQLFEYVEKAFPNLSYLRAVDTKINDEKIGVLLRMKKLESVRLSNNTLKNNRYGSGNSDMIRVNRFGIQKVGNIKFLVL